MRKKSVNQRHAHVFRFPMQMKKTSVKIFVHNFFLNNDIGIKVISFVSELAGPPEDEHARE